MSRQHFLQGPCCPNMSVFLLLWLFPPLPCISGECFCLRSVSRRLPENLPIFQIAGPRRSRNRSTSLFYGAWKAPRTTFFRSGNSWSGNIYIYIYICFNVYIFFAGPQNLHERPVLVLFFFFGSLQMTLVFVSILPVIFCVSPVPSCCACLLHLHLHAQ